MGLTGNKKDTNMKKIVSLLALFLISLCLYAQQDDRQDEQKVNEAVLTFINQAEMALEMGNIDDAINLYKQAVQLKPNLQELYFKLGETYAKNSKNVDYLRNAVENFEKYLEIETDSEKTRPVKTTVDRLEYMIKYLTTKSIALENLNGRWVSNFVEKKLNDRSFIFDFERINERLRVEMNPKSLLFSKIFWSKVDYARPQPDGSYYFGFSEVQNYNPNPATWDGARSIGTAAVSALGGSDLAVAGTGLLVDLLQSKDVAKSYIKTYEFNLKPSNDSLLGFIRIVADKATKGNQSREMDEYFAISFSKPDPIMTAKGKALKRILIESGDPKALEYYNNYKPYNIAGNLGIVVGSSAFGLGSIYWIGNVINESVDKSLQSEYNDYDPNYYFEQKKIGKIITFVGAGVLLGGITSKVAAGKYRKKAVHFYQEAMKEKASPTVALNFGVTGNGVGLTLNF